MRLLQLTSAVFEARLSHKYEKSRIKVCHDGKRRLLNVNFLSQLWLRIQFLFFLIPLRRATSIFSSSGGNELLYAVKMLSQEAESNKLIR